MDRSHSTDVRDCAAGAEPPCTALSVLLAAHRALRGAATPSALVAAVCEALRQSGGFESVAVLDTTVADALQGVWAVPILRSGGVSSSLVCAGLSGVRPAALRDAVEAVAQLLGLALDASASDAERARAHDAVARALAEQRQVLDELAEGYYEVDLRGGALFLNAAFASMLGYTRQEVMQQDYRDRQSPAMTKRVQELFAAVYGDGEPKHVQGWEYLHKDGHIVHVEGSVTSRTMPRKPHG
jgi:PAS domain S-box-containing protein